MERPTCFPLVEVSGPNEYDWVVIDTAGFVANLDNRTK